jgi:hypothetical protein
MRFDELVEVVCQDGRELKLKVSELLKLAYAGMDFRAFRVYVSKRLVAESKSWNAEPNPDDLEEILPEPERKEVVVERVAYKDEKRCL